jgi:hypothetical protein
MRRRKTGQSVDTLQASYAERSGEGWFELRHNKERWQKIQAILKPLDADIESLSGELFKIVFKFEGFPFWKYSPTPREVAGEIQETVTMMETLLAKLDYGPLHYNYIDPLAYRDQVWPEQLFPPLKTLSAVLPALALLRDELQPRIDKLMAMGAGGSRNASKVHREYWTALTQLWWKATAHKADQRRQKHLVEFLIACSEPLFSEETTETAIKAFVVESWPSLQSVIPKA